MTAMATEQRLHWEDLEVGSVLTLGPVSPSREDILSFASQFDPQPFHLDEAAARDSVFGGLCASGWHTCSLAMRLMATGFLHRTTSLGSPGMDHIKWPKPVFPGDQLTLTHTILNKRASQSRPDVGLLHTQWDMHNQHGEAVLQLLSWSFFRRRQPAA